MGFSPRDVTVTDDFTIPPEARCLTCGYLLRGLPEPVCPECGRRFDPLDAATFDSEPPKRRRRLWIIRASVTLAILLLAFGLFPRKLLKSDMTFACSQCGESIIVSRWEPKPPRWVPFRYPGFHWRSDTPSSNTTGTGSCNEHRYDTSVRFDLYMGGWSTGTSPFYKPGYVATFNGHRATPETATRVLKSLMTPSNFGITVYWAPVSAADE